MAGYGYYLSALKLFDLHVGTDKQHAMRIMAHRPVEGMFNINVSNSLRVDWHFIVRGIGMYRCIDLFFCKFTSGIPCIRSTRAVVPKKRHSTLTMARKSSNLVMFMPIQILFNNCIHETLTK